MQVCTELMPVDQPVGTAGHEVACWLHGPAELVSDEGARPLHREEISVADEA
jgi:peptide/nickel transport system ATP-binding protein